MQVRRLQKFDGGGGWRLRPRVKEERNERDFGVFKMEMVKWNEQVNGLVGFDVKFQVSGVWVY